MVWTETSKTYDEMISMEGWTDKKEIDIPVVQSLTFKVWDLVWDFYMTALASNPPTTPQLALLIIGKCGFGFSFNWLELPRSHDDKMTIQHALRVISASPAVILLIPKWLQHLFISEYVSDISLLSMSGSFSLRRMTETVEADEYLMEFLKAQVKERKAEIGSRA